MTTNDCLNKEWVKKIFSENNSAKFYVECYDNFLSHFSCIPDANLFPKYKEGDVIDEDKSVKWNREEVQRRINNSVKKHRFIRCFFAIRKFLNFLIAKESLPVGVYRSETTVMIVTFLLREIIFRCLLCLRIQIKAFAVINCKIYILKLNASCF